jgi:hypothetical protein
MLDYEKQKWKDITKVRDFLAFLEDPKVNVMEFMKTLADPAKSGFWVAAKVDFDVDVDAIISQKPDISHDDISRTTRTASEIEHHNRFKFTNGYDRHKPPQELTRIASVLGFNSNPSCHINNQLPGTLMHRHIDFVSCYTYEHGTESDFLDGEYDKQRRQPKDQKDIWRCFVALDDWRPGQIVNFEPGFWTNWKKGDVLFFDWRNTPHSTANCGIHNRPLLKITGTVDDDTYITESKKSGEIKKFKV